MPGQDGLLHSRGRSVFKADSSMLLKNLLAVLYLNIAPSFQFSVWVCRALHMPSEEASCRSMFTWTKPCWMQARSDLEDAEL